MKYLHTMVRVTDIDASLRFYCDALGLRELRRTEYPKGRFTLVFLAAPGDDDAQVELTYNWDREEYGTGRAFGHLAYEVDDVYESCRRLLEHDSPIAVEREVRQTPGLKLGRSEAADVLVAEDDLVRPGGMRDRANGGARRDGWGLRRRRGWRRWRRGASG